VEASTHESTTYDHRMRGTREVYVSVDVEADGPVPGPYSLVSLGACVAAVRGADGEIEIVDPEAHTFYRELKPISDRCDPDALAVSGLTREHLEANGTEPHLAMADFVAWVDAVARTLRARPVFAAYPLAFDWQFTYHYLVVYAGRSPFGHSAHFDMKTAYALLAGTAVRDAVKRNMSAELLGSRRHTHNALDDAQGQADLLAGLLTWQHTGS
jgi:DNA polymerase III epsilon subunit-like protein